MSWSISGTGRGGVGAFAGALAAVAAVICFGPPAADAASGAAVPPPAASRPVIVVGVAGLTWDELSAADTPAIWGLLTRGSAGALSVRAADMVTCVGAGWLTLGAGNRAAGPSAPPHETCPAALPDVTPDGDGARVAAVAQLWQVNDRRDDGTRVGLLADTLERRGACVAAVGPGAALAAADHVGRVAVYRDGVASIDAAFLSRCAVTIVDGSAASVRATDATVGSVVAAAPTGSTILLAGVSDAHGDNANPSHARLHVAIAVGDSFDRAQLVSGSTRRSPFVQLVDVAPTVLHALGATTPDAVIGEPWRATGAPVAAAAQTGARVASLIDLDRAATGQRNTAVPFFVLIGALLAVYFAAIAVCTRTGRRAQTTRRAAQAGGVVIASAIGASYLATLAPWWRAAGAAAQFGLLVGITAAWTLLLVVLAYAGPWRRHPLGPPAVAAGLVALVIGADLLAGAPLQMFSPAGYSPLVAGRFAGIGNVSFGVFAAAVLLAAAGATRVVGVAGAAVIGVIGVAVDGAPPWGSDVGGMLALVPAVVVLCVMASGVRLSWRWVGVAVLAAIAVVVGMAVLDYQRSPSSRTHLGRFVGEVLHGDTNGVVSRKIASNWHLLTSSVWTMLVPLVVIAAGWLVLARRSPAAATWRRLPALRHGLVATWVAAVVGFFANDSGVAVAALAAAVAVPLAVAAAVAPHANSPGPGNDTTPRRAPRLLR